MKKKITKGKLVAISLFLVSVCLMVFGYYDAGGICLAFAAPVTTENLVTTETLGGVEDLLAEDIEKLIVEETRGRAPLNAIIKEIKRSRKTTSLHPKYFAISEKPLETTITEKYTPTATPLKTITVKVANAAMFGKRDTVALFKVKSYRDVNDTVGSVIRPLIAIVLERNDDSIKIQAINGKVDSSGASVFADAISDGTVVVRMGKAEHELSMQTDGTAQLPVEDENYCQNFMFQVMESDWSQLHGKNVNYGWSELFKMSLNDYAVTKELSYFFGAKGKTVESTTGKLIYTCDGIIQKLDKVFSCGGAIDESLMADIMQLLFDGNNGNSTRFAFLGSDLYLKFQKIPSIQKQIDGSKEPFVVFGLEFDRIKMGGNTLLLMKHPLFSEVGYSDYGTCLDMDNIEELIFKPFTKHDLDLKSSGEMNAQVASVTEVSCVVVKNRDTHMLITP